MKRIVALAAAMLLWSLPVMAETYTWTDKSGTVNYSDDYYSVPKQYRKNVRKLGDMDAPQAPADTGKSGGEQPAQPLTGTPGAPAAKPENELYGGKKAKTWQQEFKASVAEYKQMESQLLQVGELIKNPAGISVERMNGLPQEFAEAQKRYNDAIRAYNDLNDAANKAGLPAEYRK